MGVRSLALERFVLARSFGQETLSRAGLLPLLALLVVSIAVDRIIFVGVSLLIIIVLISFRGLALRRLMQIIFAIT